ncbi:MAG: undecaprenyl-phosphate glucose phosphotransferase [Rikenellaceae bacterium]
MSQVENTNKIISITVVAIDLVAINLFFYIFRYFWLKLSCEPIFFGNPHIVYFLLSISYIIGSLTSGVVLYHRQIRLDQVALVSLKNMVAFFITWLALSSITMPSINFSKSFAYFFTSATAAIILLRLILRSIIMRYRSSGHNQCMVLFLGSSQTMRELFDEMSMTLTTGYKVLGYFDDEPDEEFTPPMCKYLGRIDEALEYIKTNRVDRLYSAIPTHYEKNVIRSIINYCEGSMIRFYVIPNLRSYFQRRVTLEMFSNVPVLSIHAEPLALAVNRAMKRLCDIVISVSFLISLFPIVFIVVGTITKLTSKGAIFFKQRRHGLDGREFWCYKFRSMRENSDADRVQATKHDSRKTKFGDFIRRTSIDELPQFINVLKGEMSVVGPRPHMLKHTEEYSKMIDTYMVRHYIRPGITGWAQVTGFRGETKELADMQGRVRADIWYLEHWTLMLDLYIIYKTVANIVARRDNKAY